MAPAWRFIMCAVYNPFQPNKIVAPGMFVGRVDELAKIEQCLFQTKHGNPQHFLIQGERGIGKSSLLMYVEAFANGQLLVRDPALKLKFLTVSIDLGSCLTSVEVIKTLARGLKQAATKVQTNLEAAKALINFLGDWEVFGLRYHKPEEIDPEDVLDTFVEEISKFSNSWLQDADGILILIDEADQPPIDARLGQLLKSFTERLSRAKCDNVIVGMAGLPILLRKLRDSHESSPRIFDTLLLEPLEIDERKKVVELGLQTAFKKNGFATKIEAAALDMIAELSEGYPHFVQQFSYSAFENSKGETITVSHVNEGANSENGALEQLGRKYFNELYFEKINSPDYRRVLDTMAEHGDQWVSRGDICTESSIKSTTVDNALKALKERNIILSDKQGMYRLPTKSFAAWINATKASKLSLMNALDKPSTSDPALI
jgi:hypothetical protein